ncbi:MAG: SpoIIE family protein phosphatase [Thermoleophilaceae bacterium]|nr:SpoIIE family protein phosphatase [Thermoleophilaceae bacterium]
MSPFDTSRREARASCVRALNGATGLCAIAVAVGAATAIGPLTTTASSQIANPAPPDTGAAAEQAPATPAPVAETPPPTPVAETTPPTAPVVEQPEPAPVVEQSEPVPIAELAEQPARAPAEQPAEEPADELAPTDDPGLGSAAPRGRESEALADRESDGERGPESAELADGESDGERGRGSRDEQGRGSDDDRGRESEDQPDRGSDDERGGAWVDGRDRGAAEDRGREPADEREDVEEDDADEPGEDREPASDTGFWYDPEENPGLWRAWLRIPNLTGAIGIAGAGAKENASIGISHLTSPLSLPVPPIGAAPPEPPLVEDPAPAGEPSPPPSGEGPPPPASAPTARPGTLPDEDGAPEGLRRAAGPVSGGTGGTGGGGVADTVAGGTAGGAREGGFIPAPAAGADFDDRVGRAEGGGDGSANPTDERDPRDEPGDGIDQIIRPVERIATNTPDSLKYGLAALGVLSFLLGFGYLLTTLRARSLARQRRDLLREVGLLQSALLPPVPEKLGALRTSVAYRPADGPGAGGDFYDVLPLTGGRVGFILGDVSGHGRGALARTAFMRYTLRAYLEAGLEPRIALQVAGRVIDENLGGDFATVLLAVHDPETGSLTYATAGHPAPIVVGPYIHHPVTAGSSPPIGVGVPTGLRQTTVPLVPGSVACLFTDGLMDARADGGILGRERLEHMLEDLGDDASARGLIERVALEARLVSDDIAAVVVSPTDGTTAVSARTEQLELSTRELEGPIARRFLIACGVPEGDALSAIAEARSVAADAGGAVLNVVFGDRPEVGVLPRDVEGIEAASRRASLR